MNLDDAIWLAVRQALPPEWLVLPDGRSTESAISAQVAELLDRPSPRYGNSPPPDTVSVTPRVCEDCDATLKRELPGMFGATWTQHYRPDARFCSSACRQRAYRRRKAAS